MSDSLDAIKAKLEVFQEKIRHVANPPDVIGVPPEMSKTDYVGLADALVALVDEVKKIKASVPKEYVKSISFGGGKKPAQVAKPKG
jgi:hypothetical protein